MAENFRKVHQLLAVGLLAAATVVGWRSVGPGGDVGDEKARRVPEVPSSRMSSQQGSRRSLKAPRSIAQLAESDSWREEVSELSLAECAALLDEAEGSGRADELVRALYDRNGFLDPGGALARIGSDPFRLSEQDGDRLGFLCAMMKGWSRRSPHETWAYFEQWTLKDGYHPLRQNLEGRELPFFVFRDWASRDSAQAFVTLARLARPEFVQGVRGYVEGLPRESDFSKELARWDELMTIRDEEEVAAAHSQIVKWSKSGG